MNIHDNLEELVRRFHGIDIQYRRSGTDWPKPWRVRLIATKNERDNYRITSYGETLVEAIDYIRVTTYRETLTEAIDYLRTKVQP